MSTDTGDLITFVRERLDEDEAAARRFDDEICTGHQCSAAGEAFGARFDPARVLAEVAAKRRILNEIVDEANGLDLQVDGEFRVGPRDTVAEPYVGDLLVRILAQPYSSHPDWIDEWKVTE